MRSKNSKLFGLIFILFIFSCIKNKPGKASFPQAHIELGDTIVLSGYSERFYTFPKQTFIYDQPDVNSIVDTLISGSVFMVDTAHSYIRSNDTEEYEVGSYTKNGIRKKGYIKLYDLSTSYVVDPFDTNQVYVVGFILEDTLNNYSSQIRCFRYGKIVDSYTMCKMLYPMELGLDLSYLQEISTNENMFFNVCHSWDGCGSSADNYLFCYNSKFNLVTESRWSCYDLVVDYETAVYVTVNAKNKPRKVENGKFLEKPYDKNLSKYNTNEGFLVKSHTETFVVKYNEKKGYSDIKEHVFYDLIYSLESGKVLLLDSIHYDTSLTELTRIYY